MARIIAAWMLYRPAAFSVTAHYRYIGYRRRLVIGAYKARNLYWPILLLFIYIDYNVERACVGLYIYTVYTHTVLYMNMGGANLMFMLYPVTPVYVWS
jgi:hypothetical protein